MREYSFTVIEHDAITPWLVVGEIKHETAELEDGVNFFDWAAERWPPGRFTVELDPWQLGDWLKR